MRMIEGRCTLLRRRPLDRGERRQLMADHQAGQIISLRGGAEFAGQAQGAGTEQRRQHAEFTVRRQRHLHATVKRRAIERRTVLLGATQNAVFTEHGEHFAGHEGIEMGDAAIDHFHPFRMTARQTDQQITARLARQILQHAEDLGFFAAHHIRQARTLDHTRHDVHDGATQTDNVCREFPRLATFAGVSQ